MIFVFTQQVYFDLQILIFYLANQFNCDYLYVANVNNIVLNLMDDPPKIDFKANRMYNHSRQGKDLVQSNLRTNLETQSYDI